MKDKLTLMSIGAMRKALGIHSPSGHITGDCWCRPGPAYDPAEAAKAFAEGMAGAPKPSAGEEAARTDMLRLQIASAASDLDEALDEAAELRRQLADARAELRRLADVDNCLEVALTELDGAAAWCPERRRERIHTIVAALRERELPETLEANPAKRQELAELIGPVIATRHPDKTLAEISLMIDRLHSIGIDPAAVRYQIEHGLIRTDGM